MTEITDSNQDTPECQPANPVRTIEALIKLYEQGYRNFSGSDLRGVTLDTVDKEIKNINLQGVILTGSNLSAIVFKRLTSELSVDLTGSSFKDCNLKLADFSNCRIDQCNFSNSSLSGTNFQYSSCRGSDFIKATIQNIQLSEKSDFTASDFSGASFLRSALFGVFTAVDFTESIFHSCSLFGIFRQANFSKANLRSAKFGVNNRSSFAESDFTGANLQSATLSGDFSQVTFCRSNFNMAKLKDFNAQGANFLDVNLNVSEVSNATLKYCYYNSKTKFNERLDPVASGMELIEDEIESED